MLVFANHWCDIHSPASLFLLLFFLELLLPLISTLFPYTTLFRSICLRVRQLGPVAVAIGCELLDLGLVWTGIYLCKQIAGDRKSTRLNSSHMSISYAVFCLKKKKNLLLRLLLWSLW